MAKGHKHLKRLKSEKAKVKLKNKKSVNQLPKGLNVTDTSFKVKKILIREQLKHQDETEILSTRKLNIKDLLTRLRHHNSVMREEALKQLKEILLKHGSEVLCLQLSSLLSGIVALSLDHERGIRRDSLNALGLILRPISNEQLLPFRDILISYLSCAMTHINPRIKEDSLYFLDVLMQNCGSILVKDSHKILPNFLGMISRLHNEIRTGRQLTTHVSSKSTSVKWRIKVLERLANIFTSIVARHHGKLSTPRSSAFPALEVKRYTKYVPIYSDSSTRVCEINFDRDPSSLTNSIEGTLTLQEFVKYVGILMPLIFDIWLEACPDEKLEDYTETTISNEAFALLKSIVKIVLAIIDYIDALDCDVEHTKYWFRDTFHNLYMKNFLSRFPYGRAKQLTNESRKRQEDFSQSSFSEGESCLEQNLGLCQMHVWFTSLMGDNKRLPKYTKDYCTSIVKYLNDTIENCINNSCILPQLSRLLKVLFLKASPVWYASGIDLNHTLQLIVEAFSRLARNESQPHLCLIIGDIMLECSLNKLHREEAFKKFVTILPSLLLRPSIDDAIIQMISQIVLRFKDWIQEELVAKHEAIIENAKKIEITGSQDDKQSRLVICNLFYFIDEQIYY